MADHLEIERPVAIVLQGTTTTMSPLTNASVSPSKPKKKQGNDGDKASERQKSPTRSPSARIATAKKAARRSPGRGQEERATKRIKSTRKEVSKKGGTATKKGKESEEEEKVGEDPDYEEEDMDEEEEELPADGTVDLEDVDDARMIADVDQGSQKKQIKLKKKSIQFEKQFVSLAPRIGRKISAPAFAKGYFKIASLTDEGIRLAKSRDGMLCGCCLLPLLFFPLSPSYIFSAVLC